MSDLPMPFQAYNAGLRAAREGLSAMANPYRGSDIEEYWDMGWQEVHDLPIQLEQKWLAGFSSASPSLYPWVAGVLDVVKASDTVRHISFESRLRRRLRELHHDYAQLLKKEEYALSKFRRLTDQAHEKWEKKEITDDEHKAMLEEIGTPNGIISFWKKKQEEKEDVIFRDLTLFLTTECKRYLIPLPKEDYVWAYGTVKFTKLSPEGVPVLRSLIRKEYQERNTIWQTRIALTIGLLGTLIGAVAALTKLR